MYINIYDNPAHTLNNNCLMDCFHGNHPGFLFKVTLWSCTNWNNHFFVKGGCGVPGSNHSLKTTDLQISATPHCTPCAPLKFNLKHPETWKSAPRKGDSELGNHYSTAHRKGDKGVYPTISHNCKPYCNPITRGCIFRYFQSSSIRLNLWGCRPLTNLGLRTQSCLAFFRRRHGTSLEWIPPVKSSGVVG